MNDTQGWTLLALVGVLLSVIGGLIVNQFHLLRGYLDARFVPRVVVEFGPGCRPVKDRSPPLEGGRGSVVACAGD